MTIQETPIHLDPQEEHRWAIRLAYDGRLFEGWQKIPGKKTLQGSLEEALERIHRKPCRIFASGRTDKGVHAQGQVAHFQSTLPIHAEGWKKILQEQTPPSIKIEELWEVPSSWHSRFSAQARFYQYYCLPEKQVRPWNQGLVLPLKHTPDHLFLIHLLKYFEGTHNFELFCSAKDRSPNKVRHIYKATLHEQDGYYVFSFIGNAFLWKMIRCLLGTVFRLEQNGKKEEDLSQMLLLGLDPTQKRHFYAKNLDRVISDGLFLQKVFYDTSELEKTLTDFDTARTQFFPF